MIVVLKPHLGQFNLFPVITRHFLAEQDRQPSLFYIHLCTWFSLCDWKGERGLA